MAELADAQASGACGSNIVRVQVPLPALFFSSILPKSIWHCHSSSYIHTSVRPERSVMMPREAVTVSTRVMVWVDLAR